MTENVSIEIQKLKMEKNAVILAHSYQPPEIQDIADFVGDSLGLSRQAATSDADIIIFCGVEFMAETAHILAPEKIIILPEPEAGCPLADCIDVPLLQGMQELHPGALTILYINSPADVKAESYACCTSANALAIVERVPSNEIIFAPDRNLGKFIARKTDKTIHLWPGACRAHARADIADLLDKRKQYPDAEILVHPETSPEIWDAADYVLGTGGMIRHVSESAVRRFIIGTEEGMIYKLSTLFPDREFIAGGNIFCYNMKKITPDKVLFSLQNLEPRITLDPVVRERAYKSVMRMTEID